MATHTLLFVFMSCNVAHPTLQACGLPWLSRAKMGSYMLGNMKNVERNKLWSQIKQTLEPIRNLVPQDARRFPDSGFHAQYMIDNMEKLERIKLWSVSNKFWNQTENQAITLSFSVEFINS